MLTLPGITEKNWLRNPTFQLPIIIVFLCHLHGHAGRGTIRGVKNLSLKIGLFGSGFGYHFVTSFSRSVVCKNFFLAWSGFSIKSKSIWPI